MDRVATGVPGERDNLFAVEVRGSARAVQAPRFVGFAGVKRSGVVVRKNRDGADAHFGSRADDANCYLAAVGDQKTARDHIALVSFFSAPNPAPELYLKHDEPAARKRRTDLRHKPRCRQCRGTAIVLGDSGRMRFSIKHVTRYVYEQPASHSRNDVRLTPIDAPDQRRVAFRLDVSPAAEIAEYLDSFGNLTHSIDIQPPHTELIISSSSVVDRLVLPPQPSSRITFRDYLADDAARVKAYAQFLSASRYVPFSDRLRRFFWSVRPQWSEDITAYTERMIVYVRNQFGDDGGTTNVHSTVDDILTLGGGVCQDFAHLSVGLLRLAGIPARYVSGYLAPGTRGSTSGSVPAELASHAWIEALLPGRGWTDFDPTHRTYTIMRHIRVAIGRDYNDLPPVSGVYDSGGGGRQMAYELEVSAAEPAPAP